MNKNPCNNFPSLEVTVQISSDCSVILQISKKNLVDTTRLRLGVVYLFLSARNSNLFLPFSLYFPLLVPSNHSYFI